MSLKQCGLSFATNLIFSFFLAILLTLGMTVCELKSIS